MFDRNSDVRAAYRLLVPIPVTVEWPSGRQTLSIEPSHGVFGAIPTLRFDGGRSVNLLRHESDSHVRSSFATCTYVRVPSIEHTFFERLVREGRAERLAGPHCKLTGSQYWPKGDDPLRDTLYGWQGEKDYLG